MNADLARTLIAYNAWANGVVFDRAQSVSKTDYFAASPGLSFANLHATLVHIVVGELVWLARWRGSPPPELLKDARKADKLAESEIQDFAAVDALRQEQQLGLTSFFAGLDDHQLQAITSYQTQYGEPNQQPLEQLLLDLVNHGTQFRAEAAVRLTQLAASPGDIDLIVYLRQQ